RPSGTGATAPEYSGSPALLPRPAGERRASRRGHLAGSLRVDLAETAVAPRPGVVSPLGLSHRQPRGVSPAEKGTVLVAAGKRQAARGGGPGRTAGARAPGVAGPVAKSSGRRVAGQPGRVAAALSPRTDLGRSGRGARAVAGHGQIALSLRARRLEAAAR